MNFLTEPAAHLSENGAMTKEQLEIAIEFVDELLALGVLEACPDVRNSRDQYQTPQRNQCRAKSTVGFASQLGTVVYFATN